MVYDEKSKVYQSGNLSFKPYGMFLFCGKIQSGTEFGERSRSGRHRIAGHPTGRDGSYVMRGGGYNLMGGACPGSSYPAALRDPLPGNDHHPNVTFRIGLYIK